MNCLTLVCSFFISLATQAHMLDLYMRIIPHAEYLVLDQPIVNVISTSTNKFDQCLLMKNDYLLVLSDYHKAVSDLQSFMLHKEKSRPGLYLELSQKVSSQLMKLNEFAKPEWSNEDLEVEMIWPLEKSEMIDVNVDPEPSLKNFNMKTINRRAYVASQDYELLDASYMNRLGTDIVPYFFSTDLLQYSDVRLYNTMTSFYLKKRMTWIEYCQFVPKIEFEVNFKFTLRNFQGESVQSQQKIILRGSRI